MKRLRELYDKYSDTPKSIIIKAECIREGMRSTPALGDIAKWAMHDPHWLFDWDHDDLHEEGAGGAMGEFVPDVFQLDDETTVKIILDNESPYEIVEREDKIVERCHYFSLKIHETDIKDKFNYTIEAKEGVLLPRNMKKYNNVIRFDDLTNLFVSWPSDMAKEDKKITFVTMIANRYILLEIDYLLKSLILFGINKRKEEIDKIRDERRRYFQTVQPGKPEHNEKD